MPAYNLIKGDKISNLTDYRDALPVNMYSVKRDILGAKGYMLCWPGLSSFATGSGKDRGGVFNERFGEHFRVSGQKLIKVSSSGAVTELGDIPGTSQASMPYSFNTQAVIADGKMFLYDATTGFREVTDADLGSPLDGVWVDNYYFETDGEYIYHTDITDESAIDPLKYATAEFMPDKSLAVAKTQDNKVIVFGRYTLEYFVNVATPNFAFQRVETRAQKIGIVATHAKCEALGNFYITGGRKEEGLGVFVIGVGSSQRVSTREVEKVLGEYSETDLVDMRMESVTEDASSFVMIHLPNDTLLFNITIASQLGIEYAWTILKTDIAGDNNYQAINGVFESNLGYWLYGDKRYSRIGKLDNTIFSHYGEDNEWLLYSPLLKLEGQSINSIELETIPGHTTTGDATVAISMTYNGITYGTEWFQLYGAQHDYGQRFIIRRLGYIEDMVGFKLRGATSSRMAFANLNVDHGN